MKATSRRTIGQSLDVAAAWLVTPATTASNVPWHKVGPEHLKWLVQQLPDRYATATVNKVVASVRGVVRAAAALGLTDRAHAKAIAAVPSLAIERVAKMALRQTDVDRLFAGCIREGASAGWRDAAVLATLLSTGLRRTELIALDQTDFDRSRGTLHIRTAERKLDRSIQFSRQARAWMNAWLDVRPAEPGPLFLPIDKGGTIRMRRMTDQAVYDIIRRAAERAGILHLTARHLRRAFVVSLIAAGLDLDQVRHQAGHMSWITTSTYRGLARDHVRRGFKPIAVPAMPRPRVASGGRLRRSKGGTG